MNTNIDIETSPPEALTYPDGEPLRLGDSYTRKGKGDRSTREVRQRRHRAVRATLAEIMERDL